MPPGSPRHRKKPGTDLGHSMRILAEAEAKVPPSKRISARLAFTLGAVGLMFLSGLYWMGRLWADAGTSPPARTFGSGDYSMLATSAFETALADQLAAADILQATPAAPLPPIVASPGELTDTAAPASNPWVAEFPEAACIPFDLPQQGRVLEVVSGDTIKVLLDADKRVYSVRYLGATTSGAEARSRNMQLVYGKRILLVRDISDADASGLLLRYVLVDGVFVNYRLVAEGLALAMAAAPDTACLSALMAAEGQARTKGLGMWASGVPATPAP